ncbi:OLC1v1021864C1 [Oldenlandia corymbosa var. corymbosa]|uniref:OLC1v1021864C1 n=1 Tax=Oldenlandia corymbosa var. corymbosa TaxID=529605 RepID=A0AAV1BWM0_OLDCO|nr:OLC1v1021864C1 [Oldenlandia corymbosa var. corymbosa]
MDVHFDFPVLFLFSLFTFLLLNLVMKSRAKPVSKLPPGPWKLPFIGNIHQLVGSLPHHVLTDLAKKYGPLMMLQVGEVPTLVVSSPEMAKEIMKTHDVEFAFRPQIIATEIMSYNSTNIIFAPYGEYWRNLRKICTFELLSTRRVQSFRYLREEETANLIRWVARNAGSPINLTEKFFSSMYTITSRAAFGKKSPEQEAFISIVEEGIRMSAVFNIADIYPSIKFLHLISGVKSKLQIFHHKADSILETIISEHREQQAAKIDEPEATADLVDVLLKYHDGEKLDFSLTSDNIKAVLLDIFGAGSETAATTVDWAMVEMIRNPGIMNRAQEEVREVFISSKGYVDEDGLEKLKYLKVIVKETLRLHPPAPLLLPRQNIEKTEVNGYEIPAKTRVLVNAWAINRDPLYWKDPESFQPERFLDSTIDYKGKHFEYIPFGAGRRICPGMQYGIANVELPLAKLLYHFDWILPMKLEELSMEEVSGIAVRRKDDLCLIPVIINPLPVE